MELVVFIGLPASGKSTFYQQFFAHTHVCISKDLLRNNRNKDRRQRQLIEEAFAAEKSVVVDNTHPSPEDRAQVIALAGAHGARVIGYYFRASVAESVDRNSRREGKARVPDVAIFTAAKKLTRPSLDEGFDELLYVRMGLSNNFIVEPWKEDMTSGI